VKLAARDLPKDTKDPVKSIKTIPSSGETCPTPGITAKRYVAA
jgi:TusA-related sulfurtransferase